MGEPYNRARLMSPKESAADALGDEPKKKKKKPPPPPPKEEKKKEPKLPNPGKSMAEKIKEKLKEKWGGGQSEQKTKNKKEYEDVM